MLRRHHSCLTPMCVVRRGRGAAAAARVCFSIETMNKTNPLSVKTPFVMAPGRQLVGISLLVAAALALRVFVASTEWMAGMELWAQGHRPQCSLAGRSWFRCAHTRFGSSCLLWQLQQGLRHLTSCGSPLLRKPHTMHSRSTTMARHHHCRDTRLGIERTTLLLLTCRRWTIILAVMREFLRPAAPAAPLEHLRRWRQSPGRHHPLHTRWQLRHRHAQRAQRLRQV